METMLDFEPNIITMEMALRMRIRERITVCRLKPEIAASA
jgi:hypothetical protein